MTAAAQQEEQVRTITIEWLKSRNACKDQVAIVKREWGDTIPLTRENLRRAVELQLDLDWLVANLELTTKALRVYNEATAEARRVYYEARAEARRVYCEATVEALADALDAEVAAA